MRRISVGTVTTILLLGLAGPGRADAADDSRSTSEQRSWFARLNPFRKDGKTRAEAAVVQGRPTSAAPSPAALEAREKADYLRRIEVCGKLHDIAILTNDEPLRRKADQLDQRAWDIYFKHTAQAPVGSAGSQADERILERRLGTSSTTGQSLLPSFLRRNSGHASIREE